MDSFHKSMVEKYGFPDFTYKPAQPNRRETVRSLGINDAEFATSPADLVGGQLKFGPYLSWITMLERCGSVYQKKKPSYLGVTVCDEWKLFSNFALWCKHAYKHGWKLDKDLIVRSNMVYSPDTCLFVPDEINSFLTTSGKVRGEYPQGVTKEPDKTKYRARISIENKRVHLGYFNTILEAHKAWQLAKIERCKILRDKYSIPELNLAILRLEDDYKNNRLTEDI